MKRSVLCLLALVLTVMATAGLASAQVTPTFKLGFKALADQIPGIVGTPLENERHNAENGDGLQQTTTGLMAWRKADNWTAFTNGSITWINGPAGVQSRHNTERFSWEAAYVAPRPTKAAAPTATPRPLPTATPRPLPTMAPVAVYIPYYTSPYTYTSPLPSGTVIQSQIDGAFTGWTGDTVFLLTNGQVWQQSSFDYEYTYDYGPDVLIYASGGRYKMQVEGLTSTVYVKRLK